MVYVAEMKIRHNGKRIAIGEQIPKDVKKEEIERLLSMKAIIDPDAEAKAIKEATAKKAETAGE
ncbi:hypothetical protein MKX41_10925 [Paenibacillus sp. FSL R5-0475]|uniref:hypothetical protein n=1 Tax=Paenibacillus sp. FSL R5-0475 TaxID=2921643 RepID=UPI0030F53852